MLLLCSCHIHTSIWPFFLIWAFLFCSCFVDIVYFLQTIHSRRTHTNKHCIGFFQGYYSRTKHLSQTKWEQEVLYTDSRSYFSNTISKVVEQYVRSMSKRRREKFEKRRVDITVYDTVHAIFFVLFMNNEWYGIVIRNITQIEFQCDLLVNATLNSRDRLLLSFAPSTSPSKMCVCVQLVMLNFMAGAVMADTDCRRMGA